MNLQKLFHDLNTYHKEEKESNKIITPDFNAFHIISSKETQLFKFIGELLNIKGVHAQGKIFLDQFIDSFLRKEAFFNNALRVNTCNCILKKDTLKASYYYILCIMVKYKGHVHAL